MSLHCDSHLVLGGFSVDSLVLLSLFFMRIEDSLIESVRVHLKLNHRFVPLTLSIFRSLQSDGNLEKH